MFSLMDINVFPHVYFCFPSCIFMFSLMYILVLPHRSLAGHVHVSGEGMVFFTDTFVVFYIKQKVI